jgi:hypothetical protein
MSAGDGDGYMEGAREEMSRRQRDWSVRATRRQTAGDDGEERRGEERRGAE